MNKELTLAEISVLIGVSENQLLKNWKKYANKLEKYGITKEGKGKKAIYYIIEIEEDNIYRLSYNILQGALNKKDLSNILKFLEVILCNTNNFYTNKDYSEKVGVSERTIKEYRQILRDNNIILPNELCHQKYFGVTLEGKHINISQEEYSFVERAVVNTQVNVYDTDTDFRLFEANRRLRGLTLKDLGFRTIYSIPKLEISHKIKNNPLELSILYNAILYSKGDYK